MPKRELISIFSFNKIPVEYENPFRIFYCFDHLTWLLIMISFLISGIVHHLSLLSDRSTTRHYPKSHWIMSMLHNYVDMFSTLVGHGDHQSQSMLRDPLIFWILGSFIIRNLFSNDFTALLLSTHEGKIDYFSQLYSLHHYRLIMEYNSSTTYFFKRVYTLIFQRLTLKYFSFFAQRFIHN